MRLLVLILLFHLSTNGFSQLEDEKSVQVFKHLYSFNFEEADSIISSIDSTTESSNYNFLRAHYMRWFHLPIHNQNDSILDAYKNYLTTAEIDMELNKLNYNQINGALLSAEYNYNKGNYYKALQSGSMVYDLVKNNLEQEPEQQEVKLLSALYHYYYQYYKTENSVIGTMIWFFKEGDKETGLKWLEEVANQESIVSTEALIYLSHIYLRLENNPDKALYYARKLHQLYPNNLKFYELYIESHFSLGKLTREVYSQIQELKDSEKTYFQKYGNCYEAICNSLKDNLSVGEKETRLNEALSFINQNGGGSHLSSLLFRSLYHTTGDEEYLKQKNKHEVYQFALTGYTPKQKDYNYKN